MFYINSITFIAADFIYKENIKTNSKKQKIMKELIT